LILTVLFVPNGPVEQHRARKAKHEAAHKSTKLLVAQCSRLFDGLYILEDRLYAPTSQRNQLKPM